MQNQNRLPAGRTGLWKLAVILPLCLAFADVDGHAIDSMDAATFTMPSGKGSVELVGGRDGNALKFTFNDNCSGVFAAGKAGGMPEWDKAAGISFWVKGDGSRHLGGLEFVWNGDFSERYACSFPIDGTDWRKVVVPWHDLIPEMGKTARRIDSANGNTPSKLGPIWFGKWWYWKDYAAHSYTVDDIRLERTIPPDSADYRPAGSPLERVRAKLKAGKPITIVTMGDSLTDMAHWSNRKINWPSILNARLKEKYGSDVTIVNPAMGGTELRQNLVVMPRWVEQTSAPDLVTVFFGGNDWNSGMRGEAFYEAQKDAIDRIRRATKGRADVLILTTFPALENGTTYGELADACTKAASVKKTGIADVYSTVQAMTPPGRATLFVNDKVHLALPGQTLVAESVLAALAGAR